MLAMLFVTMNIVTCRKARVVQVPQEAAAKSTKPSKKLSSKAADRATAGAAASKADKAAEQQRQAELELLMMDDSALQDIAQIGEH